MAILVSPREAAAFWPWPVDAFHGQVYSAMFITPAISALVMAGRAAAIEYLTIGTAHLVAGTLMITGLLFTDASTDAVTWDGGTWVWVAGFAALAVVGAAMVASGTRWRATSG